MGTKLWKHLNELVAQAGWWPMLCPLDWEQCVVPARMDRAAPRGPISPRRLVFGTWILYKNLREFCRFLQFLDPFWFYQFEFLAGFNCRCNQCKSSMATKFLGKRLPWPQHSVCWQVHPSLRRWLQGRPDQRLGWRMDQSFGSRCGAVSDVPSKDVAVSVVCFMYFGHLEDHSFRSPLLTSGNLLGDCKWASEGDTVSLIGI